MGYEVYEEASVKDELRFQPLVTKREVILLFSIIEKLLAALQEKNDVAFRFLCIWSLMCQRTSKWWCKKLEVGFQITVRTNVEEKTFGCYWYRGGNTMSRNRWAQENVYSETRGIQRTSISRVGLGRGFWQGETERKQWEKWEEMQETGHSSQMAKEQVGRTWCRHRWLTTK